MTTNYRQQLDSLYQRIRVAKTLVTLMPEIEEEMLRFLQAERMTVYQWEKNGRGITSRHKSGDEILEIKVPLTTSSIAGFVALCQKSIRIKDVYDEEELKALHPKLRFNQNYDKRSQFRSRSMIVVPIKPNDILLGVVQVINNKAGAAFTKEDQVRAEAIATLLGKKFQHEFKSTQGPFDYLIQQRRITPDQLNSISQDAERRRRSVGSLLVADANVPMTDIGESLEQYYQVPFMPYDPDLRIPKALIGDISPQFLKTQGWVPISGDEAEAVIIIDDPSNHQRILEMQELLCNVRNFVLRIGLREDISRFVDSGLRAPVEKIDLTKIVNSLPNKDIVDTKPKTDEVDDTKSDNAIIQLVNGIVAEAYHLGASDIHFEPEGEDEPGSVRIRMDGICRRLIHVPAGYMREVLSRIKIMSRLDIAETRKPQDGKAKLEVNGRTVELRVATLPVVHGEGAVLRILAAGGNALPMSKLNLSTRNLHGIEEAIAHPHGLFLVVGPTGSGKTTTLHAILGHINTPERKIWTAEDPVEITQRGMQQLQVSPKIGLTFAAAMRAFLRADPDVILIGEMRDQETSHIGIEASLTGHLVFSTLHTNSAPETITRLLDLGVDPISFSDALLGVLAQRLMRTLCADCKEPYTPDDKEFSQLVSAYGEAYLGELEVDLEQLQLYRAVGCDRCGSTGYRGRTGIHELLICSEELSRMIYRGASIEELRQQAIKDGMRTLVQDGVRKILNGQSDFNQLLQIVAA